MKKKSKLIIKLMMVVFLLVTAGISIGVILQDMQAEKANKEKLEELQRLWQSSSTPSVSSLPQAETEKTFANPQFAELIQLNEDLVGWLEVGELSVPVVQTIDNEYYLTHDFYRQNDPHGAVFADARNTIEEGDDNLVLYGHNYNKSKLIFYEVEKYKDPAYANQHPVFSFTTLYEKRDYVVLGVFISNTDPKQGDVFDYHNQLRFTTTAAMNTFIGQVRERSLLASEVEADSYDQLITLSTCGYEFEGERIVLVGRRIRSDENVDELAKTVYTKAVAPLMPEVWSKLYGKKQQ